ASHAQWRACTTEHVYDPEGNGMVNSPKQRTGLRPLAESKSQPDSGIASASAYSNQCVAEATVACQRGVPATGGTPPAYRRQPSRSSISASTVMPSDLCAVYTQKYFGVRGSSSMTRPTVATARISSTTSQWKAWLTAPQRSGVFFRVMVRVRDRDRDRDRRRGKRDWRRRLRWRPQPARDRGRRARRRGRPGCAWLRPR